MVTSRMTTVQEPPTDAIPPFPFFIENPAELNHTDLPTNSSRESHGNQELSRVNNVRPETSPNPLPERCQFDHPIRMVVPSAGESHLQDELSPVNKVQRERGTSPELRGDHGFIDTNPLPERCQFSFSDGRQCAMARSDIHPSLCRFHAEREEQLFGVPSPGGNVVGRALDLPELYSACGDLTTAGGVNRALGQVFRLLAQRRISRQEAATFGHLAQLLLRTISAARAESTDLARSAVRTPVESTGLQKSEIGVLCSCESHQQVRCSDSGEVRGIPETGDQLSPVNKDKLERGTQLASRTTFRESSPRPSTCR